MPFDLYLHVPQWQGGPNRDGILLGSRLLGESLAKLPFQSITCSTAAGTEPEGHIWHHTAIRENLASVARVLESARPHCVLTLGGDCSVDMPVIENLSRQHGARLGVIYIDAHADVNTPVQSPSKRFHGMFLRSLLDLPQTLSPQQICFVGIRDLDPGEKDYIRDHNIRVASSADINEGNYQPIRDWCDGHGIEKLHVHLDLDALDPSENIGVTYRVPGGIRLAALRSFLAKLRSCMPIMGFTVTEFAPQSENSEEIAKVLSLIGCFVEA